MKNIKTFELFSDWFKSKEQNAREEMFGTKNLEKKSEDVQKLIDEIILNQGTSLDHRNDRFKVYSDVELSNMSDDEITSIWQQITGNRY